LERPLLHILKDGIAYLSVQHPDRDEIEVFIHRQLPADEQARLFTAQRVALIAVTAGAIRQLNRLARRMLEIEPGALTGGRKVRRSRIASVSVEQGEQPPEVSDSRRVLHTR
jgi:hypothetical protein